MKRKVFILYANFYTPDGVTMTIGGIQTYIKMLCEVIINMGMIPVIYQYADREFKNKYNEIDVYGIPVKSNWSTKKKSAALLDSCKQIYNKDKDIIVFASDIMVPSHKEKRVIGIQHGISWDIRKHEQYGKYRNMLFLWWRAINALKVVKRIRKFDKLVCVDYNFLNWYRTQLAHIETEAQVIPNCTEINDFEKQESNNINIIFARRFCEYRGTRIFSSAISRIIKEYDNVNITFAGSGPDELYLKSMFDNEKNISFIRYDSQDSLEIHKKFQIAVVPTIGSEGTSLSLLEAMSAKCAVIASNVGGMTNIILDNYNGILINPNEEELYNSIKKLIDDEKLRKKIAQNGFDSVSYAFNRKLWVKKWEKVLNDIIQD